MNKCKLSPAVFRHGRRKIKNMAKKFEIIGLSLLLVAFGWECFSQTLSDNKVESLLTELHHKIDMLWECEYAEFTQSPQNTTTSIALVDMNMTNRQWKSYEQIRADFELSDEQEEFGQMARIILYISGSICVILANGFKKGCLWKNNDWFDFLGQTCAKGLIYSPSAQVCPFYIFA